MVEWGHRSNTTCATYVAGQTPRVNAWPPLPSRPKSSSNRATVSDVTILFYFISFQSFSHFHSTAYLIFAELNEPIVGLVISMAFRYTIYRSI